MRRDDHPAGNLIGDNAAKALADDIQTVVERGGGTCRGDHIAVVHVERVDVQSNVRKQRLKLVFKLPVGGGPFAAEYARIAQYKRAQTQPNNFRPVVSGLNQAVEQRLRRALQHVLPVGYNHNFSRCDCRKILRRMQGKTVFRGQESRFFSADRNVKALFPGYRIAKQNAGDGVVERAKPVHRDNSNVNKRHLSLLSPLTLRI